MIAAWTIGPAAPDLGDAHCPRQADWDNRFLDKPRLGEFRLYLADQKTCSKKSTLRGDRICDSVDAEHYHFTRENFGADPKHLQSGLCGGSRAASRRRRSKSALPSHACELELKLWIGRLTILRYPVVDDLYPVINLLLLAGQARGSIAPGLEQREAA